MTNQFHKRLTRVRFAAGAILLVAAPFGAFAQTFSDGTFRDEDWTAEKISGPGTTVFSVRQSPSGGNPGAYRRVTHRFRDSGEQVPTRQEILVGHLKQVAVYDPSIQGAITSISYSYDLINLPTSSRTTYWLLLFQDGNHYTTSRSDSVLSRSWSPFVRSDLNP